MEKLLYHILLGVTLVGFAWGFVSCSSKQTPINKLADLTKEVQQNSSDYSDTDWTSIIQELGVIEDEIKEYKAEYTDEEIKEIGRLKGIILGCYTKHTVRSIKNGVENAINEAEGIVDGFLKEISPL